MDEDSRKSTSLIDWHSLGEVQYRKWEVYAMEWDVDVGAHLLSGAPYGSCIASIRSIAGERRSARAAADDSLMLELYTSSGVKLASEPFKNRFRVVAMGWSDQESLVVVVEDGTVLMYDIFGKLLRSFLLLADDSTARIEECQVWGAGIVALTSEMELVAIDSVSAVELLPYTMATGLNERHPVTSMAVLQPQFTSSGNVEVILGTQENTVLVVDVNGPEDQLLQERIQAPITKMAVAPNGRFLACFTANGMVTVMSTSFTTKVLDFDTNTNLKPLQMIWCGEDSVILHWKHFLLMVGPYGHWVNFPYNTPLYVVPEADCCRIVTSTRCELLQRVPASTEAIRRIGSTDPAAMLYDAMEAFDEGDVKADENIRSIDDAQLVDAVHACIAAAGAEFFPAKQKHYLKAAAYGMGFCSDFDATEFVETSRKLRVLNEVRRPRVGLPLTSQQYDRLTAEVLVDRLIARRHHHLALSVCEYLSLSTQKVLTHWACEKLKSPRARNLKDEQLRDLLRDKLKACGMVSYTSIALTAWDHGRGRKRLATMLLDFEPQAADQVKLLLSMGENELALQKAVNSMETDLVFLVLLHIEHNLAGQQKPRQEDFFRMVYNHPDATALLKVYYRHKLTSSATILAGASGGGAAAAGGGGADGSALLNMCVWRRDFLEAGTLKVVQSYQPRRLTDRVETLRQASSFFGQARDLSFQQKATDEQVELLLQQQELERKYDQDVFLDMSVSETINNLFVLGGQLPDLQTSAFADAARLMKVFKVPEKRFWHLKVKALSSSHQWDALRVFANERKSPIGYGPFAAACIQQRVAPEVVASYIERIPSFEERFGFYMQIDMWSKAVECAVKLKDRQRLAHVRNVSKDPKVERLVDQLVANGSV